MEKNHIFLLIYTFNRFNLFKNKKTHIMKKDIILKEIKSNKKSMRLLYESVKNTIKTLNLLSENLNILSEKMEDLEIRMLFLELELDLVQTNIN